VPNVRELLLKWSVQPRTFTAGKYKRTVSLTDNASPEELERFQGQLETIHEMFGRAVKKYRPQAKLEEVTTGEHWSAEDALEKELGLVDELGTSHSYLLRRNREYPLVFISQKKSFWDDGLGRFLVLAFDQLENRLISWVR
jgi:serine protease SohB